MTIQSWEHRRADDSYLSLPVTDGPRYSVRRKGDRWDARQIQPGERLARRNVMKRVGTFETAKAAMMSCQWHAMTAAEEVPS
jgi:hypothetical protein